MFGPRVGTHPRGPTQTLRLRAGKLCRRRLRGRKLQLHVEIEAVGRQKPGQVYQLGVFARGREEAPKGPQVERTESSAKLAPAIAHLAPDDAVSSQRAVLEAEPVLLGRIYGRPALDALLDFHLREGEVVLQDRGDRGGRAGLLGDQTGVTDEPHRG